MSFIFGLSLALIVGVCMANPTSRIVGGQETDIETYPSIVQLEGFNPIMSRWSHVCGANILNELYLLSAAHCTDPYYDDFYSPENRRIRAGTTYRNTGGVIRNVADITNHPEYNIAAFVDADICIIRLSQLLTFGVGIQPIAILPQDFVIPNHAAVTHAGWGQVGFRPPSSVLRFVDLQHLLNCDRVNQNSITNNMICAGTATNSIQGACSGDSGGPLYYEGVLAGIVSWGPLGCVNRLPTVSARVASFTNWILENTPSEVPINK